MGYCSDDLTGAAAFGINSEVRLSGAIRLPMSTMQRYKGGRVTHIKVALGEGVEKPSVWIRTSLTESSKVSQSISQPVNGWNDVQLNRPLTIDGSDLYIGFTYTQPAGVKGILTKGEGNANTSLLAIDNIWDDFHNDGVGILCIQAVVEADLPEHDLGVIAVETDSLFYHQSGQVQVTATIENLGTGNTNGYYLAWSIDGQVVNADKILYEAPAPGETFTAHKTFNLNTLSEGAHKVEVILNGGEADEKTDNNICQSNFYTYKTCYGHKVLLEHFTSLPCVNCPPVDQLLESVVSKRNDVVWAAHHVGYRNDEFTIDASEPYIKFGVLGNPYVMLDRYPVGEETPAFTISNYTADQLSATFDKTSQRPAFVQLEAQLEAEGRQLKATIGGQAWKCFQELYPRATINVFIVEDDVPAVGSQAGDSNKKRHDNIVRAILTRQSGDLPTWTEANTFAQTYTAEADASWNLSNLRVVVFATAAADRSTGYPTGEVLNATQAPISLQAQATLPYRQTFDDVSDFETFIVEDGNNDESTWQYDDIMLAAKSERNYDADDWLITPAFELKKGQTYQLKFNAYNELEDTETIDIFMGTGSTASALTTNIMPATTVTAITATTFTVTFVADNTDFYRIGFHHRTTGNPYFNFLYIDNITLEEVTSQAAPAAVTDLIVTPGEKGALSATITLRTPKQTIDEQPLTQLNKVDLYRDGQLLHSFASPAIDAELTYDDTEGLSNGSHTYKAIAVNSKGSSSPTETTTYIGIDVPGPVENLHFTYDYDTHKATVSWDAPSMGAHGGYVDTSNLRYSLRKYPMSSGKTITAPISTTHYEEEFDIEWLIAAAEERYRETEEAYGIPVAHTIVIDGQGLTYYFVKAISDIGEGAETTSESRIIGEPYPLPFAESFSGAIPSHFWHKPVTSLRNRWYEMSDNRYSQDGDNGFLAYTVSVIEGNDTNIEETAIAHTGRLDLSKATTPVISLYYFIPYTMSHPLNIKVSDDGLNFTTIGTIDTSDETMTGRYVRAIIPLTGISNPSSCYVGLEGTLTNSSELIYVDNITIYDQKNYDLAAHLAHLPSHLWSGEPRIVKVDVSNIGETDVEAEAYDVDILVDGQLCGHASGTTVKVGETETVSVAVTATVNMASTSEIFARVNYAADENTDNNTSNTANIKVRTPSFPVPQHPVISSGVSILSWNTPEPPRSQDETVTESFEDYEDFTTTDLGDWVLIDGDKNLTYSWGEDYNWPNRTRPHAFIVMTPAEVELSNGGKGLSPSWQAHSGAKMLMSSSSYEANDWLISPDLSGSAQTITFFARGTNSYAESFEVLYSTTDNEPESFTAIGKTVAFKGAEWKQYTYQLPEGSRYFAIRKVTNDGNMLFIDDITFVPETHARQDLTLLGYNVYCDGERINDVLITGNSFGEIGNGDYYVTAVYDKGESALSEKAIRNQTGIRELPADTEKTSRLYDLMGRPVSGKQKGIYIQGGKKVIKN
ncbi:MAG: choice-of-anchor J domain-containing protein [Prevotella sp.]|nr:choice-of-anchor J domain-containing protein [Prevotella sp.]